MRRAPLLLGALTLVACTSGSSADAPARLDDAAPAADSTAGDALFPLDDGAARDARSDADTRPAGDARADAAPVVVEATNPVMTGDHPDPSVVRTTGPDGKPLYYLVATVDTGDIPLFRSSDLLHWTEEPKRVFQRPGAGGVSLSINGKNHCHIWAPQLIETPGSWMLAFTANRVPTAGACPGYAEDGGIYLASATAPTAPFATAAHDWEPLPAGAHLGVCPNATRDALPHSVDIAAHDCQGGPCANVIRLDPEVWRDPASKRWWLAYAWYTNSPALAPWEYANMGEHVSLVELDAADPYAVRCDPAVAEVFAANPHDAATLDALGKYCPRCTEMLSNTRGRAGEEMARGGHSWGVNEGPSLFRRKGMVYALFSGSAWDSAYYHVWWAAAPTVEELAYDGGKRVVGRYLVPSLDQSFGHGEAVLGPDGESWYFVHHRLRHAACVGGDCARDVWTSPIEFEDRGDGKGDVWIKPRFPAEDPKVRVTLP